MMRILLYTFLMIATVLSGARANYLPIKGKQPAESVPRGGMSHGASERNLLGLERESKYALPRQALAAADRRVIRILAIKAQFRKEVPDDPNTTGTGTFDLRTRQEFAAQEGHTIDPAPHNNAYFLAHLQALKEYYEVVSNGRLTLTFDIYPREEEAAYDLDSTMAYYGLQPPEFGLTEFYADAFAAADRDLELRFTDAVSGAPLYDAFVVFHPGSDQQNNLPNFGQATPGDLFTGYLKLGAPIFVQNDSAVIVDGMVMPETVSQDGRVTALNAVMAHEFGHQLGLVDLYDSRTFNTVVGDFSLMDNNGFGVNIDFGAEVPVLVQGVMPIFPDAWSRAYLGFVDVVTVSSGTNVQVAPAEKLTEENQIIRVPINADEYFLIEYRRTDLDGDGVTGIQQDENTGVFLRPVREKNGPNTREYDYLTPGIGMVIWRVDELAARLDYDGDGINNFDDNDLQWFNFRSDPRQWDNRHQFLTLMEADGLVQFGREYFAGYGSAKDYFDINNNRELGPFTNPNSAAASGAYTGITIGDISAAVATMNCDIRTEGKAANWPNFVGRGASALRVYDLNNDGEEEILTSVDNYILAYRLSGGSLFQPIPGTEVIVDRQTYDGARIARDTLGVFGRVAPDREFVMPLAIGDLDGDGFTEVVAGTSRFTIAAFNARTLTYSGEAVKRFETFIDEPLAIAPIIADVDPNNAGKEILVYTMTNRRIVLAEDGLILTNEEAVWPFRVMTDSLHRFELVSPVGGMRAGANAADLRGAAAADFDRNGTFETAEVYLNGTLRINYAGQPLTVEVGGSVFSEIALGDIDNDGYVDIVFGGDNRIYAYNWNGTAVDNFPLIVNGAYPVGPVRSAPALVDLDGDGVMELFVGTRNGEVVGLDRSGHRLTNFPRAAGGNIELPLAIAKNANSGAVVALTREGEIAAFTLARPRDTDWNALYGGVANSGSYIRSLPAVQRPGDAIGYVYNYPNPARESTTIRFTLRETGPVSLRLYNTAGDLVLESSISGTAGVDNELDLDTSRLASGVYFCQLETSGGERKHCSVAIVK